MPGPNDNTENQNITESQALRDLFEKLQQAEPNDTPFGLFEARLKENQTIDPSSGMTYRDVIREKFKSYYGESWDASQFNQFVDGNIAFQEEQQKHPIFTSREQMVDFYTNRQAELDAQKKEDLKRNPMLDLSNIQIEDHGGDPYMGHYPDGTPVDGALPVFDWNKLKNDNKYSHSVWRDEVEREEAALTPSLDVGVPGSTPEFDIDFEALNKTFMHDMDKRALGQYSYSVANELRQTNPEAAEEVESKLLEMTNATDYDPVAVRDYLKEVHAKYDLDPNDSDYNYLLGQGDAADPALVQRRNEEMAQADRSASYFTEQRDELIKKAERIRELNDIENEILGGVELNDYEQALLAEELGDLNKQISMYQGKVAQVRERSGNTTAGMSPEEKIKYQAEQNVIKREKKEWGDVLSLYGLNYREGEMDDIQWPEEVGTSIQQSVGEYLDNLENMDYDEYVRMQGKSKQELLKDYAYRKFWPEFKQMVKNYDPSWFTGMVGNVLDDWTTGANISDVSDVVDTSNMTSTGGEPEEEYVRDMIQKAVLLYYMAEEGKDPTTFFGQGEEWGTAGIIPGANPVTQPIIRGGHEGAVGAIEFIGLEGTQSGGATIRDDLRRKSVVGADVSELFGRAGLDTPDNIKSWSQPSNWERIQDITTDVVEIGFEFAVFDIATGGLGNIGSLGKLGTKAAQVTKGTRLAQAGLRTEAGLTKLAGEMTNFIRSAETIAATSKNPMSRFLAKRALQGGNAIKEGVRYELVGQIFKDERLDFTSGVAGHYGKSIVTSLFPKAANGTLKKKVLDFFGKGTGEIGEESLQTINDEGFDKFMATINDPTERTWFLATSFILGSTMGGKSSTLQEMALKNYDALTPDQKTRFDEMTGRIEFQKMSKLFADEANLSPLAKEIRAKMKPNMNPEEQLEIDKMSDSATDEVIEGFKFPVSDRAKARLQEENRGRMNTGQDFLNNEQMVEILSEPEDVSGKYQQDMPTEERVSNLQDDIEALGYQNNNVYDQITALPDGQTKTKMLEAYKTKQRARSKMFSDIKNGVNDAMKTDSTLNINPLETQSKWDTLQEVTGLNTLRKRFQDQDIYLKKFIQKIKKGGGKVTDAIDTYLQMSLSTGRASAKRFQVLTDTVSKKNKNSIVSKLSQNNISDKDWRDFLYSLNAKEKNAQLRKTHGDETDLTSGMTDAEADAIQQRVKDEGKWDTYMGLQEQFKKGVVDPMLDEMYSSGLLDDVEYEALKNTYEYYAPTKVDPEKLGFDSGWKQGFSGHPSKGVKGLKGSAKLGHETRFDPFYKAIDDYVATVIRSERNNNIRSFADLLRANNLLGKGFKIVDEAGKTSAPHTIEFFENGERKYMEVLDKELGQALEKGNMRDADMAAIVKWVQPLVRFKRMTSTMRNPSFVPTNFMRDFGMAYWRLESLGIKGISPVKYANTVRKAIGAMPKILRAVNSGKPLTGEWGEAYQRALSAGAITNYADFINSEGRIADLQKEARLYAKDPTKVKAVWDATTKWIETLSQFTEEGVRLATFKMAQDTGLSVDKSAFAAREVTMNFDRKGTMSWITNTMYMFSNAGIQGSYNLLSTLTAKGEMEILGKKVPVSSAQAMSAGLFTTAILLNMLNEANGGEEGMDSIKEFDREKNLVFLNPFSDKKGDYIKIPIPQGLNIVKSMGDQAYDYMTGRKEIGEVVSGSLGLMVDSFSPLQGGTMNQRLAPTFLDPFVQVWENKNYFGGDLAPTDKFSQGDRVRAYQKFSNATVVGDFFATKMNQLTGGSKVERGLIDYSPNVYDNYFQFIFGGTGKFYAQSIMSVYDAFGGEFSLEETKPPIISSFVRFSSPTSEYKSRVYEIRNASTATVMTDEDFNNLQTLLDKLVEAQEMDPDKASKLMKGVRRNQIKARFAKENDMTFDEASDFMKGK